MPAKKAVSTAALKAVQNIPTVYPLKAGLIDIGVNLCDGMYKGYYHHEEKPSHPSDIDLVVDRAASMGVVGLIITGGNLKESQEAVELAIAQNKRLRAKLSLTNKNSAAKQSDEVEAASEVAFGPSLTSSGPQLKCYATVGCHPTRTCEMKDDPKGYIEGLRKIIASHSVRNLKGSVKQPQGQSEAQTVDPDSCVVVAIGECGLDYDRLHFTEKAQQLVGFEAQFALVEEFQLPMFLHDRNTGNDFADIMRKHKALLESCGGGVVHSFTGDEALLKILLDLDLYIGINGCSMKTKENLEVVKKVPLNRLMLETDGPWCEIRKTHDSYQFLANSPAELQMAAAFPNVVKKEKFQMGSLVKSRYEPVQMIEVLEVVFALRKDEPEIAGDREALAAIVRKNTETVFPLQ